MEDGQIAHGLNHAFNIAVILKVQIEAEVAHKTAIIANLLLNRIWLLRHQQFVLFEVADGCDAGHEEAGALDKFPLVLLITVFFFGDLHQLDYDVDQVLIAIVDELPGALVIVLHDEGQSEEEQVDVLRVKVHHPVILLLVIFAVRAAIAIVAVILKVLRILVCNRRVTLLLSLVLLVTTAILAISLQFFFLLLFLLDEVVQFLFTFLDDVG